MTIGQGGSPGAQSWLMYFIESSFGAIAATVEGATTGALMEPLNIGITTVLESQKLDTINKNRGFSRRVDMNKVCGGTIEQYLHPLESPVFLTLALGGGIDSSAGSTGVYIHSISAGNFDDTITSLTLKLRKGSSHYWQYSGGRINQLTIAGSVGEPIKASYEFMFRDSTLAGTDISGDLSISSRLPFTFADAVFRYHNVEASLGTTTVEEHITDFELTVNNNLEEARALGSNILTDLIPTRREVNLKITQRFDTNTAYNRMIQATQGMVEILMTGPHSLSSDKFDSCRIRLPKVFVASADPEVGAAGEVIQAEINFDVLVDEPDTTTGRDIGITIENDVASY